MLAVGPANLVVQEHLVRLAEPVLVLTLSAGPVALVVWEALVGLVVPVWALASGVEVVAVEEAAVEVEVAEVVQVSGPQVRFYNCK